MLRQFFLRYQTSLILLFATLLALSSGVWFSTRLMRSKAVDSISISKDSDYQTTEPVEPVKSNPLPHRHQQPDFSGRAVLFTRPLSEEESKKIEKLKVRLMENGQFTEAQYYSARARVLTEGLDSLSAAKLLESLGEHPISIAEYAAKAYADTPNNPEAVLIWADTLRRREEQISAYLRVLELDPNSARALHALGTIFRNDAPHKAIEYFARVESLKDPLAPVPYSKLAFAYERIGEYDKALTAYRKAYERDPDSDKAPFIGSRIADLESGIYEVPLWHPSDTNRTDGADKRTPASSEEARHEAPNRKETERIDDSATRETEGTATEATGAVGIQEFFESMSEAQRVEFENFVRTEYPDIFQQEPLKQRLETGDSGRFSPDRVAQALQTLNRYGPENGMAILKKDDPDIAKQLESLFLKRQQAQ